MRYLQEDALVLGLEPVHGILLGHAVLHADSSGSDLSLGDAVAGADEDDIEVHAEDTGGGVVLEAEIDVLGDAEAEAAGVGEVLLLQLVLLDLEGAVEDLVGLEATDLFKREKSDESTNWSRATQSMSNSQ